MRNIDVTNKFKARSDVQFELILREQRGNKENKKRCKVSFRERERERESCEIFTPMETMTCVPHQYIINASVLALLSVPD